MRFHGLWLAAMLALLPAVAAGAAGADKGLTRSEETGLELALERGRLIYAYDQAAWHGTDDLQAKLPDFPSVIGGWIVDGPEEAPRLVFYDKDEAEPHAVYVAEFAGNRLTSSRLVGDGGGRSLSPERKSMIAALASARAAMARSKPAMCKDKPFNTVVLPPESAGAPHLVYFLTPQTESEAIPMGGHFLVKVGADGRAGKPWAFTKSCLEMPLSDASGGRPEAIGMNHVTGSLPTEIHVFSSLAAKLPVVVIVAKTTKVWVVDRTRIVRARGEAR